MGGRPLLAPVGCLPWAVSSRARRAWRRLHPVRAHSSSSIRPLSGCAAFVYHLAISLVSTFLCAIDNPTAGLLLRRAGRCEGWTRRGHFHLRQQAQFEDISGESTRPLARGL